MTWQQIIQQAHDSMNVVSLKCCCPLLYNDHLRSHVLLQNRSQTL